MSGRDTPRLGRGLASLLGDASQSVPPAANRLIALEDVEPGPFQPRGPIEPGALTELAASIAQQGVLQPILVRPHPERPKHFQIVAGERRWRASREAGLTEIPCFVRDLSDHEAMAAAMVENLQRQDLDPIEEAEGLKRLVDDFGLTQERLATALGKSRSHVANQMRLLGLPRAVRDHVRAGRLSPGHVRPLIGREDAETVADEMIRRGLNVRQAEALVSAKPREAGSEKPAKSADIRAVEADLSESLGMIVTISHGAAGGALTIRYRSLDQLDHLVASLGRHARRP